jgi:hypothetical protein
LKPRKTLQFVYLGQTGPTDNYNSVSYRLSKEL